jgi:hypothetical protein
MQSSKNNLFFKSNSGQLTIEIDGDMLICSLGNIRAAGVEEYLDYMSQVGNLMKDMHSGKVLTDISNMTNYDISTRAAAVKELPDRLLSKAPYFVLAVIKGKSIFENLSMQASIATAKPLSKKFLDGKLFETKAEALQWLKAFPIPTEFTKL